jgi:hypothetical protein
MFVGEEKEGLKRESVDFAGGCCLRKNEDNWWTPIYISQLDYGSSDLVNAP